MSRCIGIDLGTTNSVAAIREGAVHVLQNMESQDLTRSVVGEHKGKVLVGQLALDRQLLAPQDTIESIKRLMGRGFRDSAVQKLKEKAQFQIVEPSDGTDDDVRVVMGGKQYSPIEISSMILKKVKEDAEKRLGDTVEYAVITVPAYFTDKQIDATRKAGRLAGLKVQKILDEPTAAAIAFGVDNVGADDSPTVLVYDLGGGTFDVSVMAIVGGSFVALDIEGDMWLGGDDFDRKIMDHVLLHISTIYGVNGSSDPHFMVELKKKAEQAKRALSTMSRTDIIIPGMLKDDEGNMLSVELELSRSEFEGMIAKDVARSMEIVQTAIRNAGETMTPDQIDLVLLVGGSSYIPLVQKSLAELFGKQKLRLDVDPMKCVAYGASILSHKWNEKVECENGHVNPGKNSICEVPGCGALLKIDGLGDLVSVTPMDYGIRTRAEKVTCSKGHENPGKNRRCSADGCREELVGADDCFEEIIKKGTSFPMASPETKRFWTPAANLRRLSVPIYAGLDPVASKNELQATVWLELPDHIAEGTPVDVAFSLDEDGILREVLVELKDGSGIKVKSILGRGDKARDRLEKKLEELRKRKDQARGTLDPSVESQWEALYGQATRALNANDTSVAGTCANQMEGLVQTKDPEWKRKAGGLCGWTDLVLDYSYLLDPPKTEQLRKLMRELQGCIENDDEEATAKKFKELDKASDDLPGPVYTLTLLHQKIGTARSKGMVVEAEQVLTVLREVESAFRANDFARGRARRDSIDALLARIGGPEEAVSGSTGPIRESVLRGSKGGSR